MLLVLRISYCLVDFVLFIVPIRDAERAHTGKGIWDEPFEDFDDEGRKKILGYASWNDPDSHVYKDRMTIVRHKDTKEIVAAAGGFFYPECTISKSMPGMSRAVRHFNPQYDEESSLKIWDKLDYLDECFPDLDYENSWMIEAVYTDPRHRGHGIARHLISYLLGKGKSLGYTKALISCAIGNEGARRVYEKCGYVLVGQGHSEKSLEKIGSPGFYILRKDL